jgi:hypothetical protein
MHVIKFRLLPFHVLLSTVDTAMSGKSVIFSNKHRTSNGNEDDSAERAPNAYVKWDLVLWHIHVYTSWCKLTESPNKRRGMQNLEVYESKKYLW